MYAIPLRLCQKGYDSKKRIELEYHNLEISSGASQRVGGVGLTHLVGSETNLTRVSSVRIGYPLRSTRTLPKEINMSNEWVKKPLPNGYTFRYFKDISIDGVSLHLSVTNERGEDKTLEYDLNELLAMVRDEEQQ